MHLDILEKKKKLKSIWYENSGILKPMKVLKPFFFNHWEYQNKDCTIHWQIYHHFMA